MKYSYEFLLEYTNFIYIGNRVYSVDTIIFDTYCLSLFANDKYGKCIHVYPIVFYYDDIDKYILRKRNDKLKYLLK